MKKSSTGPVVTDGGGSEKPSGNVIDEGEHAELSVHRYCIAGSSGRMALGKLKMARFIFGVTG
jgi:hypothetical protein